jgi:hypothetical protein
MDPTYAAAVEHIEVMEKRIRQQVDAIGVLEAAGGDTTDANRRLKLLDFALSEMRIQLAQLAPTAQQVAAPAWVLPLGLLDTNQT